MLISFETIVKKYGKPNGILHCGGNIAEEAQAYDSQGVKDVCWIEANPELIPTLRANVKQYGHKVIEACVSDIQDFEVTFHISNNAGQSSSFLELGTHKIQHPSVYYVRDITMKTKRLDSMGHCWGEYDFLNLDLQGSEMKAMRGLGDGLKDFKWIYCEVNKAEVYVDCPHVNDIDLFLNGFGFKRVETAKWIGDWTDALYIKK